jgi:hypothetical protein
MNYQTAPTKEIPRPQPSRERVSRLLFHYPRVSDQQSREILDFLRSARHLDLGLLTTNEQIRPQLDAFMADHKRHFRLKWTEGLAVVGGIALLLATLWLLGGAMP